MYAILLDRRSAAFAIVAYALILGLLFVGGRWLGTRLGPVLGRWELEAGMSPAGADAPTAQDLVAAPTTDPAPVARPASSPPPPTATQPAPSQPTATQPAPSQPTAAKPTPAPAAATPTPPPVRPATSARSFAPALSPEPDPEASVPASGGFSPGAHPDRGGSQQRPAMVVAQSDTSVQPAAVPPAPRRPVPADDRLAKPVPPTETVQTAVPGPAAAPEAGPRTVSEAGPSASPLPGTEVTAPSPAAPASPAAERSSEALASAPPEIPPTVVYAVQVGAYAREHNARQQVDRLSAAGYRPHIQTAEDRRGRLLYTVRLGPFGDKRSALDAAAAFAARHGTPAVVRWNEESATDSPS